MLKKSDYSMLSTTTPARFIVGQWSCPGAETGRVAAMAACRAAAMNL